MPRFSEYFDLGCSQYELDFVDVSNEFDTRVYVDPYAIEIQNNDWTGRASSYIRTFFLEVLTALRSDDLLRAEGLMSHLSEPKETFLGISRGLPKGRGVGRGQASKLLASIQGSSAFKSGLLKDLSEMGLYVEGIDRDKISDLTTNIIRDLLVDYTQAQCELFGVETETYVGPAVWDNERKNWISKRVQLPYIDKNPVLLVPKYIVRRKLSLDSQEFYNNQITDFLIAENLKANSSLVQTLKSGETKIYKADIRDNYPKSKNFIATIVENHPELLSLYKDLATRHSALSSFIDDDLSIHSICLNLSQAFKDIKAGRRDADAYHKLVMGTLTILFFPDLIQPRKEWEINDCRKRIDIVYTNAADKGFFAQRRDDPLVGANCLIVECKNYSDDIKNPEFDQLLGRFDDNRGKLGFIICRGLTDQNLVLKRCIDAARSRRGYIIVLHDEELIQMLIDKANLKEIRIYNKLHEKFRDLLG